MIGHSTRECPKAGKGGYQNGPKGGYGNTVYTKGGKGEGKGGGKGWDKGGNGSTKGKGWGGKAAYGVEQDANHHEGENEEDDTYGKVVTLNTFLIEKEDGETWETPK